MISLSTVNVTCVVGSSTVLGGPGPDTKKILFSRHLHTLTTGTSSLPFPCATLTVVCDVAKADFSYPALACNISMYLSQTNTVLANIMFV